MGIFFPYPRARALVVRCAIKSLLELGGTIERTLQNSNVFATRENNTVNVLLASWLKARLCSVLLPILAPPPPHLVGMAELFKMQPTLNLAALRCREV